MIKTEVCIIGAGPAGLAASIEAAKCGAQVTLIDENLKAGGQLFKQIHKFFGSREHHAGIRGYDIGENMLKEALDLGVDIHLRTVAYGIFKDNIIGINSIDKEQNGLIDAKKIIIACGAIENALPFPGWTLPGVMGGGAAQTMMNLYGLKPGNKVVMIGSGNVGLIVSYQLMQAGCKVVALVEAANKISGYHVHARKLLRAGVPIYLSSTVKKAIGKTCVEGAIITGLDEYFKAIDGTEIEVDTDTICIATGLTPLSELAWMSGCEFTFSKGLGGFVPIHDDNMKTTNSNIYVAGDISGIEEASSAMEEGRIAGAATAAALGKITENELIYKKDEFGSRLSDLRQGPFGEVRKQCKTDLIEEGCIKC